MSPEEVPELRIFISSPGDVAPERARALAVIARLNGEYEGRLRLHPIAWEQKTYGAHDDFQAQIEATATCDLVIGILWNRIGSALDAARYARPETGEPYESGTVFEIETALDLRRHAQLPDVALFQKNAPPLTAPSHAEAAELARNLGLMEAIRRRWQFTKTGAFKAAFNSFSDPDEFERLLEQHLRAWLAERGHGADGVVWRIRDQDGRDRTPYPGLEAYGAEHAPVFCGRDQVLELCLQDLRAAAQRGCAFLLLLGASGAGKSSLARAGLLPRLNKAGAAPGVDGWREATFRPGQDPLAALARALFTALPELAETGTPTPAAWCATVRGHAEAAANSVKAALTNAATKATTPRRLKLLLLVDQLEEAFAAPAEERAAFAAALAALARGGEAWVLATLRDDRYAGLLEQPLLLALKRDGATQDLIPPEGAELEAVIREPARRSRLHFERDAEGRDLADELRRVVTSADALPLLQMTLARLFEERDRDSDTMTFRAYREFGGLSGVVDTQAEDVFAKADPAAAAELPALLLGLVGGVTEEGRVLAREAPAAVLADTPAREALLALMVEGRLLLTDGREAPDGTRQIWVRVAHEALLRNWKRAAAILAPEPLRAKPKVEQAQREWQAGGMRRADLLRGTALEGAQALLKAHGAALPEPLRDFVKRSVAELDRERRRDLWRFRGVMAAAIVLALMAGWAVRQSIVANRQTQEAERQAQIAEASRAEAEAAGERETEAQRSLTQAANERAADAARFAEEQRARADREARLTAETAAQRDAAVKFARGLLRDAVKELESDVGARGNILAIVDYAEAELGKLESTVPGEEVRQLRAEALLRRAKILAGLLRWAEADTARRAGMAAAEAGVLRAPSAEWLSLRAWAHGLAADAARARGAYREAWTATEAAAVDAAAAAMRDPGDPDLATDHLEARLEVARSAEERGDLGTADRIVQELLRALPSDGVASPAQLRTRAAVLSFAVNGLDVAKGHFASSERRLAEAEQLRRRAADAAGSRQIGNEAVRLDSLLRRFVSVAMTGRVNAEFIAEARRTVTRINLILELDPTNDGQRMARANLQHTLAQMLLSAKNFVEARQEIDASIAGLRELAERVANFEVASDLAEALKLAAEILLEEDPQRNGTQALQRIDWALRIRRSAIDAEPSDPIRAEAWMKTALQRLQILRATGASVAALSEAASLRSYVESWLSGRPRHHRLAEIAVELEGLVADLSFAANRWDEGLAATRRAIAHIERLGSLAREPKWLATRSEVHRDAAIIIFRNVSRDEGLATIQAAIQSSRELAAHPESVVLYRMMLPVSRALHAGMMLQSPDSATRRAAPAEARAAMDALVALQGSGIDPVLLGRATVAAQYGLSETLAGVGEQAAAQRERRAMETRLNALRGSLSAEEFTALQREVQPGRLRPTQRN